MTARAYPGAPLVAGARDSQALLTIVVRDREDGRFFGLTARDLFETDQPALNPTPPITRLGKRAPRFDDPRFVLPGLHAVTNLICLFNIDKGVVIADENPNFGKHIAESIDPEDVLSEPWVMLRPQEPPVSVRLVDLDVEFDLGIEEGRRRTYGGGLEIADSSGERSPGRLGDAGAPIVTASGKLVGVVVALGERSIIAAPLHEFLAHHGLQVFVSTMIKAPPVPVSRSTPVTSRSSVQSNGILDSARIAGVNIPKNKRIVIALQYVYGIGPKLAQEVLAATEISEDIRTCSLTNSQFLSIREYIDKNLVVEGDLRRQVNGDIKRLIDLQCYRGIRHRKKLPLHGQRTHTNARTRKGPRVAIAGKKK